MHTAAVHRRLARTLPIMARLVEEVAVCYSWASTANRGR